MYADGAALQQKMGIKETEKTKKYRRKIVSPFFFFFFSYFLQRFFLILFAFSLSLVLLNSHPAQVVYMVLVCTHTAPIKDLKLFHSLQRFHTPANLTSLPTDWLRQEISHETGDELHALIFLFFPLFLFRSGQCDRRGRPHPSFPSLPNLVLFPLSPLIVHSLSNSLWGFGFLGFGVSESTG